jgi:hypothetical protein
MSGKSQAYAVLGAMACSNKPLRVDDHFDLTKTLEWLDKIGPRLEARKIIHSYYPEKSVKALRAVTAARNALRSILDEDAEREKKAKAAR